MGLVLLILYQTAAPGYGGWRGRDVWLGWGVCCLLVPPFVAAASKVLAEWRRNPYGGITCICLVMNIVGAALLGGIVLLLAWAIGEATHQWSAQPAVRAVAGAALGLAGGAVELFYDKARKVAEPRQTIGSTSADGIPEEEAAANGGRDAGS